MASLKWIIKHTFLGFFMAAAMIGPFQVDAKPPVLPKKYLKKSPGRVVRTCCAFGTDLKYVGIPFVKRNDIVDAKNLGVHHFLGGKHEVNGIVYTELGGFIDIGHLRDYADWTAYLYVQIKQNEALLNETALKLGAEGGIKRLTFNVPNSQSDEDHITMAGSIAYDLSLWHEIATYFGVSLIPFILPEKFSSFSPEDVYSNLLGTHVGMRAIESDLEYDIAVTAILDEVLNDLEVVPKIEESFAAMNKVESLWWNSKKPLPGKKFLLKRNLDTENELLPWLVEEKNEKKPFPLSKPSAQIRRMYNLKIDLNEKFPLSQILPGHEGREIQQQHFKSFIDYIRKKDLEENDQKPLIKRKEKHKRQVKNKNI